MSETLLQAQVDQQKRSAAIERALVRDVMAEGSGRRFVMSLLYPAMYAVSYVPADPLATAFNEGRRSVAMELLAKIDRNAPELLILARREELDLIQKAISEKQTPQETTNG